MLYSLEGVTPEIAKTGWTAPTATVIGNVSLAEEASIWFNCTIRGDNDPINIGSRSNIQDNSVLHTDIGAPINIGEGVTVGHKVMLHGCTIGENTLIGMGSTILNHAKIGANSIVGANSLVTEGKEFPENVLIVGSPARVVRELKPEELEMIKKSAHVYVENAKRFQTELKEVKI
ncbi:gamma carbonic anhydrase family protein [Kordiimonas sp. SCSIO 12603]|uniref:gamma carbonic anhydrase family protein n=1 Tax=Kordiimonas sp. SCSIO 12603 TaxID=2829596 RepID=UPI002102994F|nr:gamma carbonic anhydrase family protein [Kordiimonas sp. SCSIO 12603]UTW57176.1 gamma carbonic anhydrase family protein [Kordiimonas sp. SCSIO 12603]